MSEYLTTSGLRQARGDCNVRSSREHHGGPDLRRVRAWKRADHDISWLQRLSRSCLSHRSRDASEASRGSSSDQESDHSTRRSPSRSAICCAQTSTFSASSGASAHFRDIAAYSAAGAWRPRFHETWQKQVVSEASLNLPDLDQARSAVLNSLPS